MSVRLYVSKRKCSVWSYFPYGHIASFDDFETLAKDSDEFRLLLRELILILRDNPPLNRYVKSFPLESFS